MRDRVRNEKREEYEDHMSLWFQVLEESLRYLAKRGTKVRQHIGESNESGTHTRMRSLLWYFQMERTSKVLQR